MQRVGTCSICGGSVMGVRGAWYSVIPPPPDTCSSCGAVAQSDIIKMTPRPGGNKWPIHTTDNT
jgi:hypothetical protein